MKRQAALEARESETKDYLGSRKHSLTPVQATELRSRVTSGESKTRLAGEFGISRQTLYRYIAGEGN